LTFVAAVRTSRPPFTVVIFAASVPALWRLRSRRAMLSFRAVVGGLSGTEVTARGSLTGAVGTEAMIAEPSSLPAVTTMRTAAPKSCAEGTYELQVAPGMSAQPAPTARCHCRR
jgi:hypothetical protein